MEGRALGFGLEGVEGLGLHEMWDLQVKEHRFIGDPRAHWRDGSRVSQYSGDGSGMVKGTIAWRKHCLNFTSNPKSLETLRSFATIQP